MPRSPRARNAPPPNPIRILFVAGFGPIVRDLEARRDLYVRTLGIDFDVADGGYHHTEALGGVKAFALWPLSQAAESCFGSDRWPGDIPVPQGWLEFDVEDVSSATEELTRRGYRLLVAAGEEPWGQTVTRLLSPEGLLVGVTHTPWMRSSSSP